MLDMKPVFYAYVLFRGGFKNEIILQSRPISKDVSIHIRHQNTTVKGKWKNMFSQQKSNQETIFMQAQKLLLFSY